jgi:hypothetical protein
MNVELLSTIERNIAEIYTKAEIVKTTFIKAIFAILVLE